LVGECGLEAAAAENPWSAQLMWRITSGLQPALSSVCGVAWLGSYILEELEHEMMQQQQQQRPREISSPVRNSGRISASAIPAQRVQVRVTMVGVGGTPCM
jgi:hypothetical protein